MAKKPNDIAKWIIVALALATIIFNSAIVYNDVKHIKDDLIEIKQDIKSINMYLLEKSKQDK